MNRIESGPTGERRARIGIFLLMCGAFAAWFGYDGLWGYPNKNLEWARQALPEKPDDLKPNPKAVMDRLRQVKIGMTLDELKSLLGEPALEEPRQFVFLGAEQHVTVYLDAAGQVLRVKTRELPASEAPDHPAPLVTRDRIGRVEPGMSEQRVRVELGQPAESHEKMVWFVGPAAYGRFELADGKVSKLFDPIESREKSETNIRNQKGLAILLLLVTLFTAYKFVQVMRTRAVVDDDGLRLNRARVAWDVMTALRTDEYQDRGWLDLEYQSSNGGQALRLDSYHIDRFREIVEAICERKGFASPWTESVPETAKVTANPDGPDTPTEDRA